MPLVYPNIVRLSIRGVLEGEDCVNVLDVDLDPDLGAGSREDAILDLAGDMLNQWDDHILKNLTPDYVAESVHYVDLNSLDGISGTVSSTDGSTWPAAGSGDGPTLPNNTYIKMVKVLDSHNRQQRNGALRLGGIPEDATDATNGNLVAPGWITGLNTDFEALRDGINGTVNGWTTNLGVLHTVGGVASGFTFISAFSCASTVGTLRRRMPGYGS